MAQDDFSFDPRSWSKGRAQGAGPDGESAKGNPAESSPKEPESKPRRFKKGKLPAEKPVVAAEASDAKAKTALPEAWNSVVEQVSGKSGTTAPTGEAGRPGTSPPSETTAPAREPTSPPAKSPTVPPSRTQLPEAWNAVVTGFSSQLPDAQPDHSDSQDPARRGAARNRPMTIALLLSALLLASGAWLAWTTRQMGPVTATAPSAPTARQIAASEAPPPPTAVERAINLGSASELVGALVALGVAKADADAAAKAAMGAMQAAPGYLRAHVVLLPQGEAFQLQRLQASHQDGSGVVVTREDDGSFTPRVVAADLTREIKVLHGELDSESFYTSAVSAGLIDTLIPDFINAFSFDFNLASEVEPGDTFEVAFEQSVNDAGEAVGQPQLLFASLTTKTKSVALYRFKMADGTYGWFDGNGASTKRGFMRTPVDGARISSKFGMRFHPVLHYTRLHAGVDFAVPVGTPVYAAADGVVIGSHPTGCGGNMAVVQHDNGWITRYFHLSKFADGLYEGERIKQGFTLGLSGTTGTCTTGPHLHYEVRIDGEPVDPLSIPTEGGKRETMDAGQLAGFMKERDRVDVARAKQAF